MVSEIDKGRGRAWCRLQAGRQALSRQRQKLDESCSRKLISISMVVASGVAAPSRASLCNLLLPFAFVVIHQSIEGIEIELRMLETTRTLRVKRPSAVSESGIWSANSGLEEGAAGEPPPPLAAKLGVAQCR